MRIGELAKESNTPVATIRFYEAKGLLPKASRYANNYRYYDESHLDTLRFIRNCRVLDLSLTEVGCLLALKQHPHASCEEANALIAAHLIQVHARITELKGLERQLKILRSRCNSATQSQDCGILAGLSDLRANPIEE